MISGQKGEKKVGKKVRTREKSRDARKKLGREKKIGTREKSRNARKKSEGEKKVATREKKSEHTKTIETREKNEEQYFDGTNWAPY